jgi:hypothetical protein
MTDINASIESKPKKARMQQKPKARMEDYSDDKVFNDVDDAERDTIVVICGLDGEDNAFALTPSVHLNARYLKVYEDLLAKGDVDLSYPRTEQECMMKQLVYALLGNVDCDVRPGVIIGKTVHMIRVCME